LKPPKTRTAATAMRIAVKAMTLADIASIMPP
jgi:hypothetical protein